MTAQRLRRLVGFSILCETLAEAVARGIIPLFFVKGGVAMELRLGLFARATKDLDIGLCAPPEHLLPAFDRALAVGFGEFSLGRRGAAIELENGACRLVVAVTYLALPFTRIDVDLATASADVETDDVSPIALADLELAQPRPVPCLNLTEQIAQKIHALTEPLPRGRPNARARDALDILLLDRRLSLDVDAIARACARLFLERDVHRWPVVRFAFPEQWTAVLPELAREAAYETEDVAVLESRFNTFLARVQGAEVMRA